ncbi:hypothetical protein ACS0TY_003942 [Phlomoides rotata]
MNSNFTSSSSSSDDDDDDEKYERMIKDFHQQNQNLYQAAMSNNNLLYGWHMNSNIAPTHGGSVVGHKMVYRDREMADHNLFNDYFAENPR